jgi:rhodanese-related sulfurtransferase
MLDFLKSLFASVAPVDLEVGAVSERLTTQPTPYLLDVREPDEYRAGHIAAAHLIPLGQLEAHLDNLPREREILCVCRTGNRSGVAVRRLRRAGLNAVNVRGGMLAWQAAGLPVKQGR